MKILRYLNNFFLIRDKIFKSDIESVFDVFNLISIFIIRFILIFIEFLETNISFKLTYYLDIVRGSLRNCLIYIINTYIFI